MQLLMLETGFFYLSGVDIAFNVIVGPLRCY